MHGRLPGEEMLLNHDRSHKGVERGFRSAASLVSSNTAIACCRKHATARVANSSAYSPGFSSPAKRAETSAGVKDSTEPILSRCCSA
eukprot:5500132-Amphidinium_carterae.1